MKKEFRLGKDQFDEICNELRPYISPNILAESQRIASRKEGCCCILLS